jgi:transcriptional regulator with PAS, ATPase and Fis domain
MLAIQSSLVGESSAFQSVIATIDKISQTDSTVLITGESGTGKELIARAIHEKSPRAGRPLVTLNCGAIPADLLESELFGYVKGAFTGATQNRIGKFEAAQGGTIFLDEIGELPLNLQVKLLRVLQTRQLEAVGSNRTIDIDVRIIAATNRDLEASVVKREFREDLYYRLNVIPVRVPALRERKSDIPILVNHFIKQFNQTTGHNVQTPTGEIMEALLAYDWPGNIRELENLMERVVILKGQGTIDLGDLPHRIFQRYTEGASSMTSGAVAGIAMGGMNTNNASNSAEGLAAGTANDTSEYDFPRMVLAPNGINLKAVVDAFENHLIDQALSRTGNNKNRASELLRMNRTTLVEKLRKRGMITPVGKKMSALAAGLDPDLEGGSPAPTA